MPARRDPRPALLWIVSSVLAALLVSVATYMLSDRPAEVGLYSATAGIVGPGERVLVGPDDVHRLFDDSRVWRSAPGAAEEYRQEQRWLAGSVLPGGPDGPHAGVARAALLDLHALLLPNGAAVAGWSSSWRYVWPRDAAFMAAALATCGHADDALRILGFLQGVQPEGGPFQARYLPSGSGPVPDGRGVELDGVGWALWGLGRTVNALPVDRQRPAVTSLAALLDSSTEAILRAVRTTDGLPAPSKDYWEVQESSLTLGTVAPLLAGLLASSRLYTLIGDPVLAERTELAYDRLFTRVTGAFGPEYGRHAGNDDRDAAVAMLLPPFTDRAAPDVLSARARVLQESRRPVGGFAPGRRWRQDGVSWTPETSLYALSLAATGDRQASTALVDWLNDHRTSAGSYPEKVLANGDPAAVAPLGWTAATVLLTLVELDG